MKAVEGQPDGSQYHVGVVIGRFQVDELTPGHKAILDHALEVHDKVIVFVGKSLVKATKRNPLNFPARKQMLLAEYPDLIVSYIDDERTNEGWSRKLDLLIKKELKRSGVGAQAALLYGSRDSFIPYYSGTFPTCELEQYEFYSATAIRNQIAVEGPWDDVMFRRGVIFGATDTFPEQVRPTVDIGVWQKGRLLLCKKPKEPLLRVIGGFAAANDQSFEHAAVRELDEEAHLTMHPNELHYVKSVRVEDFRYRSEEDKVLTLLFTGTYTGVQKPIADDDIEKVQWVPLTDLLADQQLEQIMPLHRPLVKALIGDYQARLKYVGSDTRA